MHTLRSMRWFEFVKQRGRKVHWHTRAHTFPGIPGIAGGLCRFTLVSVHGEVRLLAPPRSLTWKRAPMGLVRLLLG